MQAKVFREVDTFWHWRFRIAGSIAVLTTSLHAGADSRALLEPPDPSSAYYLRQDPERPRSRWGPVLSFAVPGLDQWIEGQYGHAFGYSAVGGLGLAMNYSLAETRPESEEGAIVPDKLAEPSEWARKVLWSGQLVTGARGMSAYHAFRTMARSHAREGRYRFLNFDEEPADVLLAPFKFSYLQRSTTWVPLLIGAAWHVGLMSADFSAEGIEHDPFTGSDAFFTGALSYGAGVWEEAAFRGWIMPELMEITGSPGWSNAITSLIFALAHLNTVSVPVVQLGLGWYFGYLTIENRWRIGESVFVHAWWDVFALMTTFRLREKAVEDVVLPALRLPPVTWQF